MGRIAALDGLRGLAILFVVFTHLRVGTGQYGGLVGVTLFFVLSGYLITRILVRQVDENGQIDFRRFYIRRARRLLPALLLVLAVTPVLGWLGSGA